MGLDRSEAQHDGASESNAGRGGAPFAGVLKTILVDDLQVRAEDITPLNPPTNLPPPFLLHPNRRPSS